MNAEFQEERKSLSSDFNMMEWSMNIPLGDELWMGMQLRNIVIVDMAIIRDIEKQASEAYFERERTPSDILLPLSALSQMWVFSVYEVLRTWRQRAKEILDAAEQYNALREYQKKEFLRDTMKRAKDREKLIRVAPSWYSEKLGMISDSAFVSEIREYWDASEAVFRNAEALRVTLAKHEVPKTKRLVAEAPGYGRMNLLTGSMYWFVTLKDDSQIQIDRRQLANEFFGLDADI